ncbi:hypothetical protein BC938DRAFT_480711 [Jimgerdemannia flammicorona]|uniref:DUF427 domain-containing protein n=1 Tax=Jimgerdemannia flammicorona TaxID=994334 RepID=A0A433QHV8_9FUNG|nr:hypothetical protein BC938DRAFT_480711 [Jimgerdemannia flammicorona]
MAQKENVWDYPRPPAMELTPKRLRVLYKDVVIADTTKAYRILETSHPPTYYIPIEDVNQDVLIKNTRNTYCEWKGTAHYYDVKVGDDIIRIWYYPNPTDKYAAIKDYLSVTSSTATSMMKRYAIIMESSLPPCLIRHDSHCSSVEPQPGDFYGGWMTSDIEGKVKGMGW